MTKDIVSKIIHKHYNTLGEAVRTAEHLNKDDLLVLMSKREIKELHGITILAYWYLTGEELPEIKEDKHDCYN